ncbi:s-methyl-5-thioribose-1-phosphate isomerase [Lentzea sp. BCCO 10_0061]|uniref:S-methyl-5-thioribose-1-phosphate isomerase n=1 Tax=Lentzea sokolovensis TaxID=3095429 RepID=A0ABU4V279_9PSEU|nr:s-methyl-5-thioribose-1-phosphate isomerase [Lentzea sp. BCCO 10_0061]MDX8145913.1 s-methyl-5-thioribose-1-phosphate isomerase [Lentzea sp. BCCO 10_0061]
MQPVLADSVKLTENGVLILDRRQFPFERNWVLCRTAEEVARAIEDMVTQSSGPYFAVLFAMVLKARTLEGLPFENARAQLAETARMLENTRRTNNALRKATKIVLEHVDAAQDITHALYGAEEGDRRYRAKSQALGEHTANLLPADATVMTHCWADLYLTETVKAAQAQGKQLKFFCTETRPYLQGARLTAETLIEMGVDTTLITDGMGAAVLQSGQVDALVTAADRVTMDGHVVNKVGTLGLAVAAHAFGVPFHAQVQAPDLQAPTTDHVEIEYRDGSEVLQVLGRPSATPRVKGHYPAFDVTPPRFVTTVVTDRGVYAAGALDEYYEGEQR